MILALVVGVFVHFTDQPRHTKFLGHPFGRAKRLLASTGCHTDSKARSRNPNAMN